MDSQKQEKIKDNYTFSKLKQDMEGMQAFAKLVLFLEKFGIKNKKISEIVQQILALTSQSNNFVHLPDRFNDHFSKSGWVAHESLNVEIMQQAVVLADAKEQEEAEELLVNYYDEETLEWQLLSMTRIKEYLPRDELAHKAMDDYLAGRYYACVPIVLMIIDGLVNDIEQTGFFAEGTDLTAWDSIAAHSSGLQELSKLFRTNRKKTTTEPILVPYRNGILHGRDLGYANKIVAAKTWSALFTVGDWAASVKVGKKHPQPEEPKSGFIETLKRYREIQEEKQKIKAWSAREIEIGKDCPGTGSPEDFDEGTPERTLAEFMLYWSKCNYGGMAKKITRLIKDPVNKSAGRIRDKFQDKSLRSFSVIEIVDKAPANTLITVKLAYLQDFTSLQKEVSISLSYEDHEGMPMLRGNPKGEWRIIENSFNPIVFDI